MIQLSKRSQNLLYFALLFFAVYIFAPRFWEPSSETWRYWVFARILREIGGFPVLSGGPLYVLYLQLFSFLKYPISFQVEFFVTHLFCAICIFQMLRRIVNNFPALLLTCAWLPAIAVVQGTAAVAGMGFLSLYLARNAILPNENDHYLSLPLGAAALCHSAYILFFAAHAAGVFIKRIINKAPVICINRNIKILPITFEIVLIAIALATIFNQSSRWDNTHMLIPATYVPVPMDNPVVIGFFQIGNSYYVTQNIPEAEWPVQDWYFTNEKAFGGAKTLLQALIAKPGFVFSFVASNLGGFIQLPAILLFGPVLSNFGSYFLHLLSWCLVIIGFIGITKRGTLREQIPLLMTIFIGTMSLIGALFLTWFSVRYEMTLLPIALFATAHIGLGFKSLVPGEAVVNYNSEDTMLERSFRKDTNSVFASKQVLFGVIGMVFIVMGLLATNLSIKHLSRLFFRHTVILSDGTLVFISFLLILAGVLVVRRLGPSGWPSYLLRHVSSHFMHLVVILAMVIILANFYTFRKKAGFAHMFGTEYLLSGSTPVSMMSAYRTLLSGVNRQTRVLALEDVWIKAFADVDLNRVYNVFGLPPFLDTSGKTEKFLNHLDVIWVSNNWIDPDTATSTNPLLRYQLHIKPFLDKEISKGNWAMEEVNGFGRIYRRKRGNLLSSKNDRLILVDY